MAKIKIRYTDGGMLPGEASRPLGWLVEVPPDRRVNPVFRGHSIFQSPYRAWQYVSMVLAVGINKDGWEWDCVAGWIQVRPVKDFE